jgi:hypothetical protein
VILSELTKQKPLREHPEHLHLLANPAQPEAAAARPSALALRRTNH